MTSPTDSPLGPLLARGRTADVHAWKPGEVIKLYHDWFSLEDIEYEARQARAVHASGARCPGVGEVLSLDGRNALVYTRVDGVPMQEVLLRKPWRALTCGRDMAELHAQMHGCMAGPELPDQQRRLAAKLEAAASLPVALRERLLTALATMPADARVCHGDLHPGNIMVTSEGAVVIDWIDAVRGNPLADLARSTILLLGTADNVPNPVLKGFIRLFHRVYLQRYFQLRPGGQAEYRLWLPIVAGARLSENIQELQGYLLDQAGRV